MTDEPIPFIEAPVDKAPVDQSRYADVAPALRVSAIRGDVHLAAARIASSVTDLTTFFEQAITAARAEALEEAARAIEDMADKLRALAKKMAGQHYAEPARSAPHGGNGASG